MVLKLAVFVGLIMVLVGLMVPGADAPWVQFQTTLRNTSFPTFNNPFDAQLSQSNLVPLDTFQWLNPSQGTSGNTTNGFGNSPAGFPCSFAVIPQCLRGNDGDASGVNISGDVGDAGFQVNMTHDTFPDYSIQAVTLSIWCRSYTNNSFFLQFAGTVPISPSPIGECKSGPVYSKVTGTFSHQVISSPYGGNTTFVVTRNGVFANNSAAITALQIEVFYVQEQVACAGNVFENMGCQLANFGRTIYKVGQGIVNGVSFIGQIGVFVGTITGAFFIGFFQSLVILFTLPNTPPVIAAIIGTFIMGALAALILILITVLRGSGP
jgi:hypothetical protein